MNRWAAFREVATGRRVLAVFVALILVPAVLTVNSFRPFVPFSEGTYAAFRLTVYYPVNAIRLVVFEPLGLGAVYAIPIVRHVVIVASLLSFYYAMSVALVTAEGTLRRELEG